MSNFNDFVEEGEKRIQSILSGETYENGAHRNLTQEECSPEALAKAVQQFIAIGASTYVTQDSREVSVWVHGLSHFTDYLWTAGERSSLKALYKVAVERSNITGEYGCMDRLLRSFIKHAIWNDHPSDYGFGQTVPDYELLDSRRNTESEARLMERRGIKDEYSQKLTGIRMKGFKNKDEFTDWLKLQTMFF